VDVSDAAPLLRLACDAHNSDDGDHGPGDDGRKDNHLRQARWREMVTTADGSTLPISWLSNQIIDVWFLLVVKNARKSRKGSQTEISTRLA
jgi:hypothetical protein